MGAIAKFPDEQLQRLCEVLADSTIGLTGSEIGTYLLRLDIADPGAAISKKLRLFDALRGRQNRDWCGNAVVAFVQATMDPLRYAGNMGLFETRRAELNRVLMLYGFELRDDGKLRYSTAANTSEAAEDKAELMRAELTRRGAHPEVIDSCRADLLAAGNFQVALAAVKALADKVRSLSGLEGDAQELVDFAFGGLGASRMPLLAFNDLQGEGEHNEHNALVSLLKGLLGAFWGTTGIGLRGGWALTDQDLMEYLTVASLLHRHVDLATRSSVAAPMARLEGRPGEHRGH